METEKETLEKKYEDCQSKVIENTRNLMKRTVRVHMINKYQRVFLAEMAFDASEFLNNMKGVMQAENMGQFWSLCRRKHFVGIGNVTLALPTPHDRNH